MQAVEPYLLLEIPVEIAADVTGEGLAYARDERRRSIAQTVVAVISTGGGLTTILVERERIREFLSRVASNFKRTPSADVTVTVETTVTLHANDPQLEGKLVDLVTRVIGSSGEASHQDNPGA